MNGGFRKNKNKDAKPRIAVICAAILLLAAGVGSVYWYNKPEVTVDIFDIGQGDALLIRSGRQEMLIDGGPDRAVLSKLGQRMPLFDRTIEYVVLTHPHADHFGGIIGVFEKYRVEHLLISGAVNTTPEYARFARAAEISGARITAVHSGDSVTMGKNARFSVLWPDDGASYRRLPKKADLNDASLVMKMTAPGGSVLFMGDAASSVEKELIGGGEQLAADILKVGHHGSRYSSSSEFLAAARPSHAVISLGRNRYGHPAPSTLLRLRASGARIWRTDRDGDIRAVFRGNGFHLYSSSLWGWRTKNILRY